jgi:hypothetical protein
VQLRDIFADSSERVFARADKISLSAVKAISREAKVPPFATRQTRSIAMVKRFTPNDFHQSIFSRGSSLGPP